MELAPLSQATRRRILVNLHPAIGEKPFAKIEARHVRVWLDDRADRPEAANGLLKVLRALFKFAMDRGIAKRNPVAEISKIKTTTDGHHTWTVAEVHKFEDRHPLGSVARLAMALLLYTGSRRGGGVIKQDCHVVQAIDYAKLAQLSPQKMEPAIFNSWRFLDGHAPKWQRFTRVVQTVESSHKTRCR